MTDTLHKSGMKGGDGKFSLWKDFETKVEAILCKGNKRKRYTQVLDGDPVNYEVVRGRTV
jgi:hypothetical protein